MTRSSRWRTRTPWPWAAGWAGWKGCWLASPPAQRSGPQCSWPGGRRTGARPSWPCSPTPESTIFPPPCTGTDPVLPPAAGALCSGSRGSFSASSPPALVFCPSPYKIHIFLLSCHWGEQNEPNPDRGRRAGHPGAAAAPISRRPATRPAVAGDGVEALELFGAPPPLTWSCWTSCCPKSTASACAS